MKWSKASSTPKKDFDIFRASEDYYDNVIFTEDKLATEVMHAYLKTIIESISEEDKAFATIDLSMLWRQIMVIRLELVGMYANWHCSERAAIQHGVETLKYLSEHKKSDYWEEMGNYNLAIAHSVTMNVGGKQEALIYKERADLFDKYYKFLVDTKQFENEEDMIPVARSINRIHSQKAWESWKTPYAIAFTMCKYLKYLGGGVKLNDAALEKLSYVIRGLYDGLVEDLVERG